MNFSEPYPDTVIMLGKSNPAEALTETRVVVPSAVMVTFMWPLWKNGRQTQ